MSNLCDVELLDGNVIRGKVVTKTVNVLVVRTEIGEYKMISRDFIKNAEDFKFRD